MAQWGGLKEPAWHMWTVGRVPYSEGLGWRLDSYEYCSPSRGPTAEPQNGIKQNQKQNQNQKMESNLPLPGAFSRTCLLGFKSEGGCFIFFNFFSSKCKKIRCETVKGSKTNPERDHKANANNWDKFHVTILQDLYFIIYFLFLFLCCYYYNCLLLLYFLFLFLPCGFHCFVCLISFFDWFSLFSP